VFGADQPSDGSARLILERAEGNPFFLEELARTALEHGEVAAGTRVPETIQGVLMARMDRLPDTPRRLLQTASVLGREVPLRLLRAMWQDEAPLGPHLEELQRLEFLYLQARQESMFVFKHALTQDVAYESLLAGRRRVLHALAGRAFEQLHADRLEDVVDRLAYHYSRTDEHDKAFTYLVRFAERAARTYAHEDAAIALREALRHIDGVPPADRDRAWLDAALQLVHSLYFLGRFPESLEVLDAGHEHLERVNDAGLSARYHFWLSHTFSHVGDRKRTVQHAEQAIAEGQQAGDSATVGRAHYVLARSAWWSGENVRGVDHGRQAMKHLEQTPEQWWLAQSYCATGINYCWMGEFDSALQMATRGYALGESIGDARIQSYALWNRGWYLAARGAAADGIAACQESLRRSPDPFNSAAATGWLGYAFLEAGQADMAVPYLDQSLARWTQFEYGPLVVLFTSWLADAVRLLGDVDRGEQLAQRALDLNPQSQFWWAAGWAERVLGHVARERGDLHAASDRLRGALETYRSIHSRFEMARTQIALSALSRDLGDDMEAQRLSRAANELFVAVGADQYVARLSSRT
jgi:tetratricopeptide (TPR) repeat protein